MAKKQKGKYRIYFPHEAGAMDDEKMLKIRRVHDWKGYGLFFAVLEILRGLERDGFSYPLDSMDELAYKLQVDPGFFRGLMQSFFEVKLLIKDGARFHSAGLISHMDDMKERSEQARAAILKRWQHRKKDTDVLPTNNGSNTDVLRSKYAPDTTRLDYTYPKDMYRLSTLVVTYQEGKRLDAKRLLEAFATVYPRRLSSETEKEVLSYFESDIARAVEVSKCLLIDIGEPGEGDKPGTEDFFDNPMDYITQAGQ